MGDVGLVYDGVLLRHETGAHPENRERVRRNYDFISAARSASGRVVSVLEGGYNLDAPAESVGAHGSGPGSGA
ncbi:MAG: hypothetical protein PVF95_06810 [bacterium]|jgi:hypothetical protein